MYKRQVGESAVQSILEERERNGEYKDIFDFVQRVNLSACNQMCIRDRYNGGGYENSANMLAGLLIPEASRRCV